MSYATVEDDKMLAIFIFMVTNENAGVFFTPENCVVRFSISMDDTTVLLASTRSGPASNDTGRSFLKTSLCSV
jgi:hypothetical protein